MSRVLVVGDIVRSRICWYGGQNQLGENILHWTVLSVGAPAATDFDLATALDAALAADAKGLMAGDVSYIGWGVQVIFPLPVQVEQTTRVSAGAGTFGGVTGAKQAAALISWQTAFAGPANRGRSYLPFVPAGAYDTNGELIASYRTARLSYATALGVFSSFTSGGRSAAVQRVIKHRGSFSTTNVISFTTSIKVGTQKRRSDYNRLNAVPF
jgi:hypothetical protein